MDILEQVKSYLNLLPSDVKEHSFRVAQLVYINTLQKYGSKEIAKYCYTLGLAHDLYEDTDLDKDTFKDDEKFNNDLLLLTRTNDITYFDYIRNIYNKKNDSYAYMVKLADLIDHLTNRKTLSDSSIERCSLLERYEKAIKILCPELEGINLSGDSIIN